ncbi:hypothetical protein DFH09DRAFT_1283908 [Mycena vulgaris]|nr:hypothetical protein DFH09DRAFT_1283908 [Mycena vulgaris]
MVKIGAPKLGATWSLPGIITFFFSASHCWTCGKPTETYPLSFSLRIRVCNDECKEYLYKKSSTSANKFTTIPSHADLKGDDVLLKYIEPWAPFLETSPKGRRIYSSRQLKDAISLLSDALKTGIVEGSDKAAVDACESARPLFAEWSRRVSALPALMAVLLPLNPSAKKV